MFEILSTCKGGGYRYARTNPPHPKRNSKGLYPLHRVIAENKLGRLLAPGEIAHHVDEVKTNDDPENIVVMTNAEHSSAHAIERSPDHIQCECGYCGAGFVLTPCIYRLRIKRNKFGMLFCSVSCGARYQKGRVSRPGLRRAHNPQNLVQFQDPQPTGARRWHLN